MDSPLNHGSSGCPSVASMDAFRNAMSIGCSVWSIAGSYERSSVQPRKNAMNTISVTAMSRHRSRANAAISRRRLYATAAPAAAIRATSPNSVTRTLGTR